MDFRHENINLSCQNVTLMFWP